MEHYSQADYGIGVAARAHALAGYGLPGLIVGVNLTAVLNTGLAAGIAGNASAGSNVRAAEFQTNDVVRKLEGMIALVHSLTTSVWV